MNFTTFVQYNLYLAFHCARRLLFPAALVLATVPVRAETADIGTLEARVERLLAQLVNDEHYGRLQVPVNYERLRARLLEETCLVSAAPCGPNDKLMHDGLMMTTEITPEQEQLIEQLVFKLSNSSASIAAPPTHLLVTAVQ
jgi:hypothetical protein